MKNILKPLSKLQLVAKQPSKPYYGFNELVVRDRHGRLVKPSCTQFRAGPVCKELGIKLTNPSVVVHLQELMDELFSHKIFFDFASLMLIKAEEDLNRGKERSDIRRLELEVEDLRASAHQAELDLTTAFNRMCDRYPMFEQVFTYVKTKKA